MTLYNSLAHLLMGLFLFSSFSLKANTSDLSKYKEIVLQEKLWKTKEWKRLMHDERNWFGDESEADSKSFFLAEDGKENYKAEILALLSKSLSEKGNKKTDAICRFPARIKWLYKKLNIQNPSFKNCKDYQDFLKLTDSVSSSIAFSSYYLESPASAFGHTLLKLSRKKGKFYQNTDLLDMGVNYAGQMTSDNPFVYTVLGLTGGFKGVYSAIPYFYKVREYNDHESRDLWVYDLNLTAEQHQRMIDHLWEVGNTYFYYYYFTENCSYNLLTLLEVANFDLELVKQLPSYYTIPSHTIRALHSSKGLIKKVTVKPSSRKKFDANFNSLSKPERKILLNAYERKNLKEIKNYKEKSKIAQILDVLVLYIDYMHSQEVLLGKGEISKWRNKVLAYRSKLGESKIQLENIVSESEAPHLGHMPRRFSVGSYKNKVTSGALVEHRFAMHSLMDSKVGQPSFATLEFFDIGAISLENKWYLNKLDVIELMTLNPVTEYSTPASLKVKLGWLGSSHRCGNCSLFSLSMSSGLSYELSSPTLIYGFLGFKTESSEKISGYNALSFIPEVGLKWDISDKFAIKFSAKSEYLAENGNKFLEGNVDFNYYLGTNHRLQLNTFFYENDESNSQLKYYYYY